MLKINRLSETKNVFDINVENNHNFYANKAVVHNCEILQPTQPIVSITDAEGEIGICILAAINLLEQHSETDYENTCRIMVKTLESIIDYQEYPIKAGENFAINRRSLGIGVTNLAAFLAKKKLYYDDTQTLVVIHELMEKIQWYLLDESCNLAKEHGPCAKFGDTKYSQGLLPIDWYKKTVDELVPPVYKMDWEGLREKIKKYGLRHSTLTAQMPCESCLEWDTVLLCEDGKYNFHELADKLGLDHSKIERDNLVGWHVSDKTVTVLTKSGRMQTNKLYYNGFSDVSKLVLDDGTEIFPTMNHRFLVKTEQGDIWKRVYELSVGDDIVRISV